MQVDTVIKYKYICVYGKHTNIRMYLHHLSGYLYGLNISTTYLAVQTVSSGLDCLLSYMSKFSI